MARENFKAVFQKVGKRIVDKAEKRMIEGLPSVAATLRDYALEVMKQMKLRSMTGNYINSFGIALYRDGKFVAVATSHDIEGQSPIQMTLAKGDVFESYQFRYEGRWQFHDFQAPEGDHRFYAHTEVLRWLKRNPPSRKKGLSYRVVTVVDYAKAVGGDVVLLQLANDVQMKGGIISEFKFAS